MSTAVMNAPVRFATQWRAGKDTIRLGAADQPTITIRVEVLPVWNVVRIETPDTETVEAVKQRVLDELQPKAAFHEDYVVKLDGWEILNERESLADAGVRNGMILLIMHRHRRPLR